MDARCIPYEEEFDVVGAFDVLEHIPEDDVVLAQMYRAAKPGSGLLLTVPRRASGVVEFNGRVCLPCASVLLCRIAS